MPRLPNPPGQRARRNGDQPNWVSLSEDDALTTVPRFPGRRPPASALEYWTTIWTSPLASMYLDADHAGIARLCRLHAKAESGKANGTELGELRMSEERYGLSPWARRRLQWEVERAGGPGAAQDRQAVDEIQRRRDMKRRLSA